MSTNFDPNFPAVNPARDLAFYGPRPTITVLCGSTRFGDAYREANLRLTLAGHIVLSIGCDTRADHELWRDLDDDGMAAIKTQLDELHRRKIDLADQVLILNVGGYIGESTRAEIDYALSHGKTVRYIENETAVPAIRSVWVWEPYIPSAQCVVEVIEVKWNGDEWWVKTRTLQGWEGSVWAEVWNDLDRFTEAVKGQLNGWVIRLGSPGTEQSWSV